MDHLLPPPNDEFEPSLPNSAQMRSARNDTHFLARCGELNRQVTADGARAEYADFHCSMAIQMDFGSVKFSSAASPCSRPKPDSPDPPQGRRTSV